MDLFGSIKKFFTIGNVRIDNNVFKLHYRVTAILLLVLAFFVSMRQYFGNPMYCVLDGISSTDFDTYCWAHSTSTVIARMDDRIGTDMVYPPGIMPYLNGMERAEYNRSYQWLFLVLFVQAVFFYAPRYVWRKWEAGRIKTIMFDLDNPVATDAYRSDRKKMLVEYFATNMHTHNLYAIRFFMCELMNTANAVIQMLLVDYFFGSGYAPNMFAMTGTELDSRPDPLDVILPRYTKCTFSEYGTSGIPVQKLDGMCVIPLNLFMQNMYTALWSWLLFVSLVSLFNTSYRLVIMSVPDVRLMLLTIRCRLAPRQQVAALCDKCEIGDWFILYQLSKNLHPVIFKEFMSDLIEKLEADDIISEYIINLRAIQIIKARDPLRAVEIV